ncbi:hypothetical protein HN358_00345 [Candidatus Uhrbacteria bacterium]|jgi:hypothetical protein|nr:hypothetical protein [Candidatus Uhrbacteria bacterium]MBT7717709.1 hypothetical protein [Candidatus Uhrbacteria bacterium]
MNIANEIKQIWNWLFSKRSEFLQLGYKDAFMAQIVMEILQNNIKHDFEYCKLYKLDPIHPVDNRENAMQATKDRAEKLKPHKSLLLKKRKLSKEDLAKYLPSATYMRAVPMQDNRYVTFEGNGRIAALKQVFSTEDKIEIELEIFQPKHKRRIQKKINKLRAMHGLE